MKFMKCPACKITLSEGSTYCYYCGRSLDKASRLDLFLDLGIAAALEAVFLRRFAWLGF